MSTHVEQKLSTAKTLAYDSHPPLRDRLAAAASFGGPHYPESDARAATLFDDIDALEVQLIQTAAPRLNAAKLRFVTLDRIAPDVYVPMWRAVVALNARALASLTIADVLAWRANRGTWWRGCPTPRACF